MKNAKWCIHQGENKRIHAFFPTAKTLRLEGMKKGAEYCPIWEVSECTYDYSGLEPLLIPVCSSLYAQEPIEVDRVSEPIAQPAENTPLNCGSQSQLPNLTLPNLRSPKMMIAFFFKSDKTGKIRDFCSSMLLLTFLSKIGLYNGSVRWHQNALITKIFLSDPTSALDS